VFYFPYFDPECQNKTAVQRNIRILVTVKQIGKVDSLQEFDDKPTANMKVQTLYPSGFVC
jgi:hypothetical protein